MTALRIGICVLSLLHSISIHCDAAFMQSKGTFCTTLHKPLLKAKNPLLPAPFRPLFNAASKNDAEAVTDYSKEDTLLRMRLALQADVSMEEGKRRVAKYSQSFPFSAVLPVQPLMYLPTEDDGVEIRFLRKKTDLKSGIEGGIRFFLQESDEDPTSFEVTAKRNSLGQVIPKNIAERLVVTAFASGISGSDSDKFGAPPTDVVRVQSVFHKWMD